MSMPAPTPRIALIHALQGSLPPIAKAFAEDWPDLVHLPFTEALASRAADLAVAHGLRGYDAVHLASALLLAELVDAPVAFAVFDRTLGKAAQAEGLGVLPEAR